MLTSQQIEDFHRDGFLAVRRVIDDSTLERLRATCDEMLEESRTVTASNAVFDLEPDHSAERPRLRRINHPVAQRPIFWEVATSPAVLQCVQDLIGQNIKFHHSKLNTKTGGGGAEIGWHQDFVFFPHTNFDLVACGIALDDSTLKNGCLLGIPGSHLKGLRNHRDEDGEFLGQITEDPETFEADKVAPIELQAGDMSIHHVCTIHGSAVNRSEMSRRLLIFQYAASDAIQLDRRPLANEFSERVLSGPPVTHARLAGAITIPLRGEIGAARSIFDRQQAKPSRVQGIQDSLLAQGRG